MKILLFAALLSSSISFAQERITLTREFVSEIKNERVGDKVLMKASFFTGGCDPDDHKVSVELKLVSQEETTPKWALERDPNYRQYNVVVQAVVKEERPGGAVCAMGYNLTAEADLRELFKKTAPSLGFDLKKADYDVEFLLPQIKTSTSFATWDADL